MPVYLSFLQLTPKFFILLPKFFLALSIPTFEILYFFEHSGC